MRLQYAPVGGGGGIVQYWMVLYTSTKKFCRLRQLGGVLIKTAVVGGICFSALGGGVIPTHPSKGAHVWYKALCEKKYTQILKYHNLSLLL